MATIKGDTVVINPNDINKASVTLPTLPEGEKFVDGVERLQQEATVHDKLLRRMKAENAKFLKEHVANSTQYTSADKEKLQNAVTVLEQINIELKAISKTKRTNLRKAVSQDTTTPKLSDEEEKAKWLLAAKEGTEEFKGLGYDLQPDCFDGKTWSEIYTIIRALTTSLKRLMPYETAEEAVQKYLETTTCPVAKKAPKLSDAAKKDKWLLAAKEGTEEFKGLGYDLQPDCFDGKTWSDIYTMIRALKTSLQRSVPYATPEEAVEKYLETTTRPVANCVKKTSIEFSRTDGTKNYGKAFRTIVTRANKVPGLEYIVQAVAGDLEPQERTVENFISRLYKNPEVQAKMTLKMECDATYAGNYGPVEELKVEKGVDSMAKTLMGLTSAPKLDLHLDVGSTITTPVLKIKIDAGQLQDVLSHNGEPNIITASLDTTKVHNGAMGLVDVASMEGASEGDMCDDMGMILSTAVPIVESPSHENADDADDDDDADADADDDADADANADADADADAVHAKKPVVGGKRPFSGPSATRRSERQAQAQRLYGQD